MKLRHYIKNYYKIREFFLYGLLSLAVGAIPAAAIAVRAELIDAATGGASAFFALLALFCGMYLLLAVLKALSLRLSERHGITQAAVCQWWASVVVHSRNMYVGAVFPRRRTGSRPTARPRICPNQAIFCFLTSWRVLLYFFYHSTGVTPSEA